MTDFHGRCHCGETEWTATLTEEQQSTILCHCNTCKTLSGGAFTLNQIIPKSALKFTKGGDKLGRYTYKGESGNNTQCYYCPNCTASPYHHQEVMGPDTYVLRTSLLDRGHEFKPSAEIFGKDRLPWQVEVAKTFEIAP